VALVAAAKSRSADEVEAVIEAGVTVIGHNYVQEADRMIRAVAGQAEWHMLGHLQKNKVKVAVRLFDMIQTLDSWPLAVRIDCACAALDRTMPVLIEVNSGREASKTGILPEDLGRFVALASDLPHLRVQGLMTMGPRFGDPEAARPYFRETRAAFEQIAAAAVPNAQMRFLSMGMSNSYEVAIEEGSNMVRIGTRLFGRRSISTTGGRTVA
jgi:pyridoxal phosphate enzyme (YggS family)